MVTLLRSSLRTDIILATLRTWSGEEAEKIVLLILGQFCLLMHYPLVCGYYFTFYDAVADSFFRLFFLFALHHPLMISTSKVSPQIHQFQVLVFTSV